VGIKTDGFPTYNFCNVIDDHEMGITHIIRGEEFISSSPRFVVLYHHLGWEPPIMAHVPLVLGPNRAKLSKRHGDTALTEYAEKGYLPEALVNFLVLLGWSPGEDREILSREELIGLFTMDRFQKHAAIFDLTKLEWMNGEYVRQLPPAELARRIRPWLEKAGLFPAHPTDAEAATLDSLVPLIQERLKLLSEAPELLDFFLKDEIDYDPAAVKKRLVAPGIAELLPKIADALSGVEDFTDAAAVEAAVRRTGEESGVTGGPLIHAVRVAVTGRTVGPGLFETMSALGLERCAKRLHYAATLAQG
jgi:glutamyl-tRNA synthetase